MLLGAHGLILKKENPIKTLHLDLETIQFINWLQIQQISFWWVNDIKRTVTSSYINKYPDFFFEEKEMPSSEIQF